ncbi:phage tape measure protein [Caldicellulosiruptor owensensis OL]|uniref:Phage tape measure protein n=1 Tax=Caldicellulosiruptor owensensis (strain ATCC 700167 / DSM 13100 / OL) TaxID=632518 RepID=E4Q634_CALOW|nr:tape measure protein [Caldicellulosiruptor owensensis]ADQ04408.1 phage tape measure protein [Caldicellulosiruptor owensensis OL]
MALNVGELFVKIGADYSYMQRGLNHVKSMVQQARSFISNALQFTVGMAGYDMAKRALDSLKQTAIDYNAQMEQLQIGFSTLLGSVQKGTQFMRELQQIAVYTPFESEELIKYSQMLLAMGFSADEAKRYLLAAGDAAAAMGKGSEGVFNIIYALGQMRTAGRVNAQDMLQLTTAGVKAWDYLAKAMGKSVAEVRQIAERGDLSGVAAAEIILAGMQRDFGGMMQKMQNTWTGQLSALRDNLKIVIGESTQNLFKSLESQLIKINAFLGAFANAVRTVGIKEAIKQAFGDDVINTIQSFINVSKQILSVVIPILAFLITHLKQVIIAWVSFKAVMVAKDLVTNIKAITTALGGMATALNLTKVSALGVVGAIAAIVAVASAGAYALSQLYPGNWDTQTIESMKKRKAELERELNKTIDYNGKKIKVKDTIYMSPPKLVLTTPDKLGNITKEMEAENERFRQIQKNAKAWVQELADINSKLDMYNEATKNADKNTNDWLKSFNLEAFSKQLDNFIKKFSGSTKITTSMDTKTLTNAMQELLKSAEDSSKTAKKIQEFKEGALQQIKDYIERVKQYAEQYRNAWGLFDKPETVNISYARLKNRLQKQLQLYQQFRNELNRLQKQGASAELIAELYRLGPAYAPTLAKISNVAELNRLVGQRFLVTQELGRQYEQIIRRQETKINNLINQLIIQSKIDVRDEATAKKLANIVIAEIAKQIRSGKLQLTP